MGRWKTGPQGAYYDPNDTGPNQVEPPPGSTTPQPTPQGASTPSYQTQPEPVPGPAPSVPIPSASPSAPAPTNYGAAPPGFEASKWTDPNLGTSSKYQVGRILAGGGTIDQAAQAVGAKVIAPDKIQFPDGFIADVYYDYGGPNQRVQYTQIGADDGINHGGDGPSGSANGLASGSQGGGSFQNQIRQLLLQQLQGLSGPVNANDPQIKAELDAQANVLERNRRDRRAADAERAAMQGLLNGGQSSGSFEQNIASGFEDKGQALTGVQAQLFGREIQSRRDQLSRLLNMAIQTGDAESARALQLQLAQMDDALQRYVHDDNFGLQAAQFQYGKDRDLAQYGAGV